jgi:hypothetical protein
MDLIPQKWFYSLQIHVGGTARLFTPCREITDLCRRSHGRCAARDGTEDNAAGTNLCTVTHGDIPEDLGAPLDQNGLPNFWMMVTALLANLFLLGKRW